MKHRKIILLIHFIFARTFFLIASSQIFENDAVLMNNGSFLQGKDSLEHGRFQFSKMYQLSNSVICL